MDIEKSLETQREIIRIAAKIATEEYKALVEPKFITKTNAIKKYKGFVAMWERAELIKPVPSEAGRTLYSEHRLAELWYMYEAGI